MPKYILLIFIYFSSTQCYCQVIPDDVISASKKSNWLLSLYEPGISMKGDSIRVSEEVKRVLTDSSYKNKIYPASYTWKETASMLTKLDLKTAFWYLINLYASGEENKILVIKTILPFKKMLEVDKVLVSTFYSYAFTEPDIAVVDNGRIQIMNPDILNDKFNKMKELVSILNHYKEAGKNN